MWPGPSAAQNGQVLQICPHCGAVSSSGGAGACSFCDASLSQREAPEGLPALKASSAAPESGVAASDAPESPTAVLSSEPEWRLEVARRLEAYRARRRRVDGDEAQAPLPFAGESGNSESASVSPRAISRLPARARKPERVEIRITQPELDFSSAESFRMQPSSTLVPVADLVERRRAGAIDASFLILAYAGFLSLFRSLGGHLSFDKFDVAVYAATFFLFYMQYFALFTIFGGSTPGMQLRGLSVVSLDGGLPSMRQLSWRSFGYLLSGGMLLLGFLWSLWDESHLTWQDRISQTYLTSAEPIAGVESFDAAAGRHTFAHK
jgi:uncharacterized RDD family membrane protein YckC